jgi:cytochrome P450
MARGFMTLNDHNAFSSDVTASANQPAPRWLIFFDPPRHTKLRALVMRAFTSAVVANLEPRIRELWRTLLQPGIERGDMDFAADFAIPLPLIVIAEMVGRAAGHVWQWGFNLPEALQHQRSVAGRVVLQRPLFA